MTSVVLVIPDAGPLISLGRANRLDLLAKLGLPIYVIDQVAYETTRMIEKPDAAAIRDFLDNNPLVHVQETTTGENARLVREAGLAGKRQKGVGEAAISEFLTNFEADFPDSAPLLIFEDSDVKMGKKIVVPGNVHSISTKAFIFGLAERGLVIEPKKIWQSIIEAGREPWNEAFDQPGYVGSDPTKW